MLKNVELMLLKLKVPKTAGVAQIDPAFHTKLRSATQVEFLRDTFLGKNAKSQSDVEKELGVELDTQAQNATGSKKYAPEVLTATAKAYFQTLERTYFGVEIAEFERKRKEALSAMQRLVGADAPEYMCDLLLDENDNDSVKASQAYFARKSAEEKMMAKMS